MFGQFEVSVWWIEICTSNLHHAEVSTYDCRRSGTCCFVHSRSQLLSMSTKIASRSRRKSFRPQEHVTTKRIVQTHSLFLSCFNNCLTAGNTREKMAWYMSGPRSARPSDLLWPRLYLNPQFF